MKLPVSAIDCRIFDANDTFICMTNNRNICDVLVIIINNFDRCTADFCKMLDEEWPVELSGFPKEGA